MSYRSVESKIRDVMTKKDFNVTSTKSQSDDETQTGPDPVDNDIPTDHSRTMPQPQNHDEVKKTGGDLIKHNLVRAMTIQRKLKLIDND